MKPSAARPHLPAQRTGPSRSARRRRLRSPGKATPQIRRSSLSKAWPSTSSRSSSSALPSFRHQARWHRSRVRRDFELGARTRSLAPAHHHDRQPITARSQRVEADIELEVSAGSSGARPKPPRRAAASTLGTTRPRSRRVALPPTTASGPSTSLGATHSRARNSGTAARRPGGPQLEAIGSQHPDALRQPPLRPVTEASGDPASSSQGRSHGAT